MSDFIDLTGNIFGKLTVIARANNNKKGRAQWECVCECKELCIVDGYSLRKLRTKSCGCLKKESKNVNHGHYKNRKASKEYNSWRHLLQRCKNPKSKRYKDYGGRGIKVCERWNDFSLFLKDIGLKPSSKHSIERINNDGDYDPSNCRWATKFEQAGNTRTNKYIIFKGQKYCLAEWGRITGIKAKTINQRIHLGWPIEKALTIRPIKGRNQYFNDGALEVLGNGKS